MNAQLAAALVIGGISAKTSLEQLQINKPMYHYASQALYVLGWTVLAYVLSQRGFGVGPKLAYGLDLTVILACMAVAGAGLAVSFEQQEGQELSPHWLALHGLGWLGVGWLIGQRQPLYGVLIPALALAAQYLVIPREKSLELTNGPGAYLYGLAWMLVQANV